MAEAPQRKYTNLPGIDTAPDIYETPELADDVSTIQASTAVSESGDSEDDDTGISRSRLQTEQARSRFQPSRVDARGVDFSDNITAQHRSYRTSTRGQRRRGEIIGDESDDEQESFSRKLMRLKREAEELEAEFQARLETGDKSKIEERDPKDVMEYISNTVDAVYAARRGGVRGAEALLQRSMNKFENYPDFDASKLLSKAIERQPPIPGSHIQRSQLDYVVDSAAEIDTRLTTLETALGLNGSTMPDISKDSTLPVFVTLEKMEQTVDTLANASSGNLDAATQHVRKLIQDAEQLKELRQEALRQELDYGKPATTSNIPDPDETERQSKINALYGTLPTIDKLSPMLPIILDRIRTLRLVHTTAYQADEILSELEKRQAKQEDEIQKWRTSLDNVVTDVKNDETNLAHNMKIVGDWVKNLEERIEKLPLEE